MEVFIVGTSGMQPLPKRFLTSVVVRKDGELFLFDCGEGTQISLKMLNLHWKRINNIFITHMHADHVTGLPGLLMLSSQVDREQPLNIFGPAKLKEYIDANRKLLDMYINYEINFREVSPGIVIENNSFSIEAVPLLHTKPCYGYILTEKTRAGEFNVKRAEDLGIPMGPLWGKLQKGNNITLENGKEIKPEDVLGKPRRGAKFSFITDTVYLSSIASHVKNSDLLVCEGMFDRSLSEDAFEKKHMTSSQAATIARDAEVKKLSLIHYSPRYSNAELNILREEACEIFKNTVLSKEKMVFELKGE